MSAINQFNSFQQNFIALHNEVAKIDLGHPYKNEEQLNATSKKIVEFLKANVTTVFKPFSQVNDILRKANMPNPFSEPSEISKAVIEDFVDFEKNKEFIKLFTNEIKRKINAGELSQAMDLAEALYNSDAKKETKIVVKEAILQLARRGNVAAALNIANNVKSELEKVGLKVDIRNKASEKLFEDEDRKAFHILSEELNKNPESVAALVYHILDDGDISAARKYLNAIGDEKLRDEMHKRIEQSPFILMNDHLKNQNYKEAARLVEEATPNNQKKLQAKLDRAISQGLHRKGKVNADRFILVVLKYMPEGAERKKCLEYYIKNGTDSTLSTACTEQLSTIEFLEHAQRNYDQGKTKEGREKLQKRAEQLQTEYSREEKIYGLKQLLRVAINGSDSLAIKSIVESVKKAIWTESEFKSLQTLLKAGQLSESEIISLKDGLEIVPDDYFQASEADEKEDIAVSTQTATTENDSKVASAAKPWVVPKALNLSAEETDKTDDSSAIFFQRLGVEGLLKKIEGKEKYPALLDIFLELKLVTLNDAKADLEPIFKMILDILKIRPGELITDDYALLLLGVLKDKIIERGKYDQGHGKVMGNNDTDKALIEWINQYIKPKATSNTASTTSTKKEAD